MRRQGLDRTRRLRRRAEFLAVQQRGRRHETPHFLVFVRGRPTDPATPGQDQEARPCRLGITVTRKVGIAVLRNRIRRLVREAFRRSSERWPEDVDLVVVAKLSARDLSYAATVEELEKLCQKLTRNAPPRSA